MAEQTYSWSAWIRTSDGYFDGDLNANGVKETFSEFAVRVSATGKTAIEKGPNPATTRPPDRPLSAAQQALVDKRTRLDVLKAKGWSSLTAAEKAEAQGIGFELGVFVPST